MIKKIIIIYLFLASTLIMAGPGLRFESIEVKITGIDLQAQTIDYVEKTIRKTMKFDNEVLLDGYYVSDVETKKLVDMKLNKKYFIRIAFDDYKDEGNKDRSETYVSFISTVPYDSLY